MSDESPKSIDARESEAGPRFRARAFFEQRFASVLPPDATPVFAAVGAREPRGPDEPQPAPTEVPLPSDFRRRLVDAYRSRQQQVVPLVAPPPEAAGAPPANNWIPIGPSILRRGQASQRPPVSGRIMGLAVAPGGARVYVASANGGVWRSDDAGRGWRSTMDAFDLDPTKRASDSLACGAIGINPALPDRIYVGTGEGGSGAEAYFGVGPVRSDSGGTGDWATEASTPQALDGKGFFALAVDPGDPERVVGATSNGIYRREPAGAGVSQWVQKTLPGVSITPMWVSSVVAARSAGTTTFYAAPWLGPVFSSTDGDLWTAVGSGFPPTASVGRICLAVRPNDPSIVYALVARSDNGHLLGVYRLDTSDNTWRQVTTSGAANTSLLSHLFGPDLAKPGQGSYDCVIAIDPNNANLIYLGGSTVFDPPTNGEWSASLLRCAVTSSGSGAGLTFSLTPTYIGTGVHADLHDLQFTPGNSDQLWVACDGGLYFTNNASGSAGTTTFEQRNVGLATLTLNHMGLHPTQEAVIFVGGQDSGILRYTGEEAWLHSARGDGGYVVIHQFTPFTALRTYVLGSLERTSNGGQFDLHYASWGGPSVDVPVPTGEPVLFYAPLAGVPNPGSAADANIVAFGSNRVWVSTTFGGGWQSIPTNSVPADTLNGTVSALAFASASKLYAGTTTGRVYRFNRTGAAWGPNPPAPISAAPLLSNVPVTCLAVDPADATGNSIYITLGGSGDHRHVWHYDGTTWQERSGPAGLNGLLDVQHNTIVIDPNDATNLYAGADIGVWRSTDSGGSWQVFSNGLPDAAVLDLTLDNPNRVLRASTYGRGLFERTLLDTARAVELYVRHTQLDMGRVPSVDGLPDPTQPPGATVNHRNGPDIRIDPPPYQTPTNQINFFEFVDTITDRSSNVATVDPAVGVAHNRVYVQVHNRGVTPANGVQVMLLLAKAAPATPSLPVNFQNDVQSGTPINTTDWKTVGISTLNNLQVGFPQVAAFDLRSSLLPPPAGLAGNNQFCALALVHCPGSDEFLATATDVDVLGQASRLAAVKDISVVAFAGPLPSTSSSSSSSRSSSSSSRSSSSSSRSLSSSSRPASSSSSSSSSASRPSSSSSRSSSSSSRPSSSSSSSRARSSSSSSSAAPSSSSSSSSS